MNREETIGFQLKAISNLIKRRIHQTAFSENEHITGMHGWIIGYLYDHRGEDIFQRDVEETFSIRRSTASSMIQLMEKNDFILRESVPQDARLKKLVLTPKAILLEEKIRREIVLIEEQMRKDIPAEDLECFLKTARRIKENLEREAK
ncbi:MarR family winged helix-turn-helix transcriptional regulator [Acidaminobacterium chupaoyuni]